MRRHLEDAYASDLLTAIDEHQVDREQLVEACRNGDKTAVDRSLGIDVRSDIFVALATLIGIHLRDAYEESAQAEADELGVRFSVLGSKESDWLDSRARADALAFLVAAEVTTAGIISRGQSLGMTPDEIADLLESELWLTDRSAAAVDALRQRLDSLLPGDKAEAALDRAISAGERQRINLLVWTGITAALVAGAMDVWAQAIDDGVIEPDQLVRWKTAEDERVCPVCAPLDGVTRRLGQPFPEDCPAHPLCRCDLELV